MKATFDILYDDKYPEICKFDLYEPDGGSDKLFIYFHGGGLENGNKKGAGVFTNWLCDEGIAVASVDYRMYPNAKFPDFIEDCAAAVAYIKEKYGYKEYYIGGSSAGGYLSMMLYFDKRYLAKYGIDSDDIDGYVFDAGQPTTHYNVCRERGLSTKAIRVDEAAPIYFVDKPLEEGKQTSRFLIFISEFDISCRLEQTYMLKRTMLDFGYDEKKIDLQYMAGYKHCGYVKDKVFADKIAAFIGKQ